MNEIVYPTTTYEIEPHNEDTATDEQEAISEPSKAEEGEDTPKAEETPQKPSATPSAPTLEERMLEMLLKEKHPDTLATALANGKTIRGAWQYVVSVMKNAYITAHGRVNGGMCGTPEVVVEIAERYLREFPEGYTEPEVAFTPKKKKTPKAGKATADTTKAKVEKVVKTAKKAADDAKTEAKRKREEIMKKWSGEQLSFGF